MKDAKIRRYIAAICTVGSEVKLCQSAAFQLKSEDEVKMHKIVSENSKIKATVQEMIAGRRIKVRNVIRQSAYGFPESSAFLS